MTRVEAEKILDPAGEAPRAVFAAMVHSMDLAIGRILAALEAEGIADETLVLFLSDNGGHVSLGASNAPLRGEKSTVFEGGIRVPAAIRWPAGLEGGRVVTQTVSALDVFPTLLSATGTKGGHARPFDGVDRWPQIAGAPPVPPGEIFFGVNGVLGRQEAIRLGDWKLIQSLEAESIELMEDSLQKRRAIGARTGIAESLTYLTIARLRSNDRDASSRVARRPCFPIGSRRRLHRAGATTTSTSRATHHRPRAPWTARCSRSSPVSTVRPHWWSRVFR